MRFVSYDSTAGPTLGVLREGRVLALAGLDLVGLIQRGDAGLELARAALAGPGEDLALEAVSLLAPLGRPVRNVFCLGWNYAEHSREAAGARGKEAALPTRPVFFTKATTTVNGPYSDIEVDLELSARNDWEVELGVVIGRGGRDIPRDRALDHVFGYTVVNDVSARDLQTSHGGQFFKGKSLDGFCPMGPWVVTRDELPHPGGLRLRCLVNGVTKQDSSTAQMIFDIPAIIEWLSHGLTLLPGDLIATGTPAGVGFARQPPEYLRPGDVVECEVEGIGTLRNRVVLAERSRP